MREVQWRAAPRHRVRAGHRRVRPVSGVQDRLPSRRAVRAADARHPPQPRRGFPGRSIVGTPPAIRASPAAGGVPDPRAAPPPAVPVLAPGGGAAAAPRALPRRFGLPRLPVRRGRPAATSGDESVWLFTGCVMDVATTTPCAVQRVMGRGRRGRADREGGTVLWCPPGPRRPRGPSPAPGRTSPRRAGRRSAGGGRQRWVRRHAQGVRRALGNTGSALGAGRRRARVAGTWPGCPSHTRAGGWPSRTRVTCATPSAPTNPCARSWSRWPTSSSSTTRGCAARGRGLQRSATRAGGRHPRPEAGGHPTLGSRTGGQRQPGLRALHLAAAGLSVAHPLELVDRALSGAGRGG